VTIEAIIALACQYGRYGYRRITALLQLAGWFVGKDRVQRIWRREGQKVRPNRSRAADSGSTVFPSV
jgi:putative transposase